MGRLGASSTSNASCVDHLVYSSGTPGGADTEDKIYLLSDREFNRYFANDELRIGIPTSYAKANGAYINPDNGNSWWWLRSPGISPRTPLCISSTGSIYKYGGEVTPKILRSWLVRP